MLLGNDSINLHKQILAIVFSISGLTGHFFDIASKGNCGSSLHAQPLDRIYPGNLSPKCRLYSKIPFCYGKGLLTAFMYEYYRWPYLANYHQKDRQNVNKNTFRITSSKILCALRMWYRFRTSCILRVPAVQTFPQFKGFFFLSLLS